MAPRIIFFLFFFIMVFIIANVIIVITRHIIITLPGLIAMKMITMDKARGDRPGLVADRTLLAWKLTWLVWNRGVSA